MCLVTLTKKQCGAAQLNHDKTENCLKSVFCHVVITRRIHSPFSKSNAFAVTTFTTTTTILLLLLLVVKSSETKAHDLIYISRFTDVIEGLISSAALSAIVTAPIATRETVVAPLETSAATTITSAATSKVPAARA